MDTRQQKNQTVSPDEWYTPRWIIDALGPFDLDPCSPVVKPYEIAPVSYTKKDDGLSVLRILPRGLGRHLRPPSA